MLSIKTTTLASGEEEKNRKKMLELYKRNPIAEKELIYTNSLFLKRQELSRILFFNELYQKIIDIHGIIIEFGCRWGQNLVTFNNLRGIYEPFNHNRRIIGFDTFQGFVNTDVKDGNNEIISEGSYAVTENYESFLSEVLRLHEQECPVPHIHKNHIKKGDAPIELEKYLKENPQTLIAFAYFDFDIYKPTLECLDLIKPYLTKGAILGFDELNDPKFPGETIALKEFANLNSLKIKRNRFASMQSYIEFE
jgi:hypothetical protein